MTATMNRRDHPLLQGSSSSSSFVPPLSVECDARFCANGGERVSAEKAGPRGGLSVKMCIGKVEEVRFSWGPVYIPRLDLI